jgi:hypothetical protein
VRRKHDPVNDASMMFRPFVLTKRRTPNRPWTQREGYLTRDLSMPEKDWNMYDALAKDRFISEREPRDESKDHSNVMQLFIGRQAE